MEKPKRLKGMKNLKNTCFINSVIQCLMQIKPIRSYMHKILNLNCEKTDSQEENTDRILFLFKELIAKTYQEENIINPIEFVEESFKLFQGVKPYTQQDAQEFLYLLVEKLDREIKKTCKTEYSIFSETFSGKKIVTIKCNTLNTQSTIEEDFKQLELPIPIISNGNYSEQDMPNERVMIEDYEHSFEARFCGLFSINKNNHSIYDCLRLYFSPEKLECCTCCYKEKTCDRYEELLALPNYLIICFKRFKFNRKAVKSSDKIYLPLTLNLQEFSKDAHPVYNLHSLIQHKGRVGRGHYTSYLQEKGNWFKFDDKHLCHTTWKNVFKAQPYIVIYSKVIEDIRKVSKGEFYLPRELIKKYKHIAKPAKYNLSENLCEHGLVSRTKVHNFVTVDLECLTNIKKFFDENISDEAFKICDKEECKG
ncbi:hypothetical protein SteCoe_13360 [Stentor coeruleus]|uniref:USP domain-containing protein n=1 Tax=Stentor coeruleus TaxID=5963 RepID=A0A1R2C8J1_9CILI|nr:hypothetical protein SteCoe_13360 [Stentor coeruleus]